MTAAVSTARMAARVSTMWPPLSVRALMASLEICAKLAVHRLGLHRSVRTNDPPPAYPFGHPL
jgi:hypothetical protein